MTPTTTAPTPDLSDLIGAPYKENGRDLNGFDCYGLAIEVERRYGKKLCDIFADNSRDPELCINGFETLNIKKTDVIKAGNLLEIYLKGELHIGVVLDSDRFIHCVYKQGVRVSLIKYYPISNIYEVI